MARNHGDPIREAKVVGNVEEMGGVRGAVSLDLFPRVTVTGARFIALRKRLEESIVVPRSRCEPACEGQRGGSEAQRNPKSPSR